MLAPDAAVRHRASYRDRAGGVYVQGDRILRSVDPSAAKDFAAFVGSGWSTDLAAEGLVVAHRRVRAPLADAHAVLEVERLSWISYPYEWSFEQYRAAALLTLDLQSRAVERGLELRDASAFNVQFRGGRPVFIDLASFGVREAERPWRAYRQFCRHFLAPLTLMAYVGSATAGLMRAHLDGIPLDLAWRMLPWRARVRAGIAAHVGLHAAAERRAARPRASPPRMDERAVVGLVDSLRRTIKALPRPPGAREWSDYYDRTANYGAGGLAAKERIVRHVIEKLRPEVVWDLGANDGRFSRLARSTGARVVAFEREPHLVDRIHESADEGVHAVVMDVTNPTPALGWPGAERDALSERGPADLVLLLGLVHHLRVMENIPFDLVASGLHGLGRWALVEWVPPTDSNAAKLLARMQDEVGYTLAEFENGFRERWATVERHPVEGTDRVLYLFRRRVA